MVGIGMMLQKKNEKVTSLHHLIQHCIIPRKLIKKQPEKISMYS
jgi:hypothetical protein